MEAHRDVFGCEAIDVKISSDVDQYGKDTVNDDTLWQVADAALYDAKESDRNCVSVAKELAV